MTSDNPQFPSKMLDQFVVRLPDGMRDRIKAVAESNGRSMNAEIVDTLSKRYLAPSAELPPDQLKRIDEGESPLLVWREFRGLSRSELAERVGLIPNSIYDIETGRRFGSIARTRALADALGVRIDDII